MRCGKKFVFRDKACKVQQLKSSLQWPPLWSDIKQIREIVKRLRITKCDIANYNTETQLVLSGDEISVDKAISEAKQMNIRSLKLQVSAPFHSVYIRDTADALKHILRNMLLLNQRLKL